MDRIGRTSRLSRVQRRDLLAVAFLVAFPVVVFGVPAAAGHPILTGDNLIQNYPLRVEVGRQIGQGHLPVWNPHIWSGAPLLAGFNAGALYPFTFLFGVSSPSAAWALNEMAVYVVSGLGLYAFCRALRLRPMAAFLAASSFAFAGAMSAQLEHIGLVAGMSWVPWSLLAMTKIADGFRRTWAWSALLAVTIGLVALAGEPRGVANAAVVVVLYGAWLVWRHESNLVGRGSLTAILASCLVWGFAIGAVQLVPGLEFLRDSQRSAMTFHDFSAGSLPVPWTILLVVPDLLGGSGSFGQPAFFGTYPLAEVTSYVGLLPLVAAVALFVQARLPGSRAAVRRRSWLVWHLVAVTGLVLAWGGDTVFGRALWHLPLYGGQRLQSRNLAIVDLALAILFAYWLDDVMAPVAPDASAAVEIPEVDEDADDDSRRDAIRTRRAALRAAHDAERLQRWLDDVPARVASALPALIGVVGCLLALYVGPTFARWFVTGSDAQIDHHYRQLIPSIVLALAVCLGGAAIAAFHRSMSGRVKAVVISSFVALDLFVFTGSTIVEMSSSAISNAQAAVSDALGAAANTGATARASTVAPTGQQGTFSRYAIYDPDLRNTYGLRHVPQPDLNVLGRVPSVQGYSSIAFGPYATATGTHGQDTVSPEQLYAGAFDQLDLHYLYTLPQYLEATIGKGTPPAGTRWNVGIGATRGWYFGTTLNVEGLQFTNLVATAVPAGSLAGVQVGLVLPDGSVSWPPPWTDSQPGTGFVAAVPAVDAIGLVVKNLSPTYPATMTGFVVSTTGQGRVALQGPLAGYLDPLQWQYVGPAYGYQLFERRGPVAPSPLSPLPPCAAGPAGGAPGSAAGSCTRLVGGSADGNATVEVDAAQPVTVVRSVSYLPGWNAELETLPPPGGTPRDLGPVAVRRHGLVQSVSVPAGSHLVVFRYSAPGLTAGLVLTIVGMVLAAAVGVLELWRRWDALPHTWSALHRARDGSGVWPQRTGGAGRARTVPRGHR